MRLAVRPAVLYHDYNGLAYPLSELYWSSSSGVLVSRHPLSSIEEIISMYCPHCLTRFMEEEARNYQNSCPSCFQCPCCCSVLVPTTLGADKGVALACSTCLYRSDMCGLVGSDKQEIDALAMEKERESRAGDAFAKILAQLQLLDAAASSSSAGATTAPPMTPQLPPPLLPPTPINDVDILDCGQRAALHLSHSPHSQNARLLKECLPRRLRLRSKRTLRCRLDVEKGKMSIIAQPKTFPLEGDSSLKIQRGKWWVKDASAIHEIPRVVLTKLPFESTTPSFSPTSASSSSHNCSMLHLEISNPKDVAVQVSLDLSAFQGMEPCAATPTGEALQLSLGAFEDELLREVDQDVSEDHLHHTTTGGTGPPKDFMPNSGWIYSTSHNVAAVIIPLRQPLPQHSLDATFSITIAMTVSTESFPPRQVLLKILF